MRRLDPDELYSRAMPGPVQLDAVEQLVYPRARRALENVGDMASLRVIDDFLAYLATPEELEKVFRLINAQLKAKARPR